MYALGDPAHVLILLGMSVVNWLFGYGLATEPDADGKRRSGLHRKKEHPGVRGLRRKTINWSELQIFEETVDQRKEEPYRNTVNPQTVKKRKFWLAVSVLCNDGERYEYLLPDHIDAILSLYAKDPEAFARQALHTVPDRIHTFIPGCIIIREIFSLCKAQRLDILKYGVREGYLAKRVLVKPIGNSENES